MPLRTKRPYRRLYLENLERRIQPAAAQPLRVALISDAVAQAAQIEASAAKGVVAVDFDAATATLDGLVDQLQSISAANGGAKIKDLGLVAHGGAGTITLGPLDSLNLNDTATNSPTWDRLRSVLAPNARIDLYACDVAAGRDGRMFVNQLARRTGAAVYASTDAVGTVRGADLVWEYNTAVRGHAPLFQVGPLKKINGLVLEDDFETNDVKAHADVAPGTDSPNFGVLTLQRTVNNLFLQADTEDWFRFDTTGVGTDDHYVRLDGLDPNGDVDLYIYAADGVTEIGRGWDGGVEEVSLVGTAPGTYYVKVIAAAAGITTSNYTLQVVPPGLLDDDAYEANDVKADADRALDDNSPNLGVITAPTTLSNLVLRGDLDWFRFETAGVGTTAHHVRVDGIPTSGDIDVYVYASDGVTEIGRGWDGGSEQVELFGTAPGIYYIKVIPADTVYRTSSSNYTLQIVPPQSAGDDPYEGNDVKADADRAPGIHSPNLGIVTGSTVLSNMVLRGDQDWFRFTTTDTGSDVHSVRLDASEESGDLDVYVYAANGTTEIGRGWDGGSEVVPLLNKDAGTYYIKVVPADTIYRTSSSNYTLQILAPGAGLSIVGPTVTEADGGEINAVFLLTRTDASDSASVTYTTADGTAIAGEDYVPKSGSVNFGIGQFTQKVIVNVKGDRIVENDEEFFLNLTGSTGVTLLATQATGVILNDDIAGTIQFSSPTYSVKEVAGKAFVKVVRVGGADGPVTINYTTSDGSAHAPGDYTAQAGTLTFLSGETSKYITVPVINDGIAESAETLNLILSDPGGGTNLGDLSTAELTIHDPAGTLQFATSAYTVNEDGITGTATITVNRVGGAEGVVQVTYATANKTAIAPSDYSAEIGTLRFEDGETTQTFNIQIQRDTVFEPNETLTLTLSTPTGGARLGVPRTATLTIVNDDDLMTPGSIVVGAGNSGVVKVLDGMTGIAKATIQAFPVGYRAGVRVATGDVNGDGTADIIAAPGPNGSTTIQVYDGTNGKLFPSLVNFEHGLPPSGGVHVAAGDLNNDGKAEIIVGAGGGASPHVKVFDGFTRTQIRDIDAFPGASHGLTLAIGDVSGDTRPEIIVGAGTGGPGTVKIYDWGTDQFVNTISAFTGLTGGVMVATREVAGGKAEIIVAPGPGGAPLVKFFNGSTGTEVPKLLPNIYGSTFRGGVTVATGDIDGDGSMELITASASGIWQMLKIFDVATGQVRFQYSPFGAISTNGMFVAVAK